jgi:methyl-accepting chemotaxis protein
MSFFRNMSISKRLYLLNGVAAVGLILLSAITIYQSAYDLREQKDIQLRLLTENAISVIAGFHKKAQDGAITEKEAMEAAKSAIAAMRYDEKEYFWINDMSAVVVMHPIKPQLNGKDMSKFTDPEGKALFSEFVKTVQEKKAGYVGFMWPKPVATSPFTSSPTSPVSPRGDGSSVPASMTTRSGAPSSTARSSPSSFSLSSRSLCSLSR